MVSSIARLAPLKKISDRSFIFKSQEDRTWRRTGSTEGKRPGGEPSGAWTEAKPRRASEIVEHVRGRRERGVKRVVRVGRAAGGQAGQAQRGDGSARVERRHAAGAQLERGGRRHAPVRCERAGAVADGQPPAARV